MNTRVELEAKGYTFHAGYVDGRHIFHFAHLPASEATDIRDLVRMDYIPVEGGVMEPAKLSGLQLALGGLAVAGAVWGLSKLLGKK